MRNNLPPWAAWCLAAVLFFSGVVGSPLPVLGADSPDPVQLSATASAWSVWGADHYALADDGASIWIGAVGGVVRWDKASGAYRRYTEQDGLPHHNVYAIAVDATGNRWFGGDGGLSRLDAGEQWTHYQRANSGLHSDYVDGLAVVADALYISHGLPNGSVSRLSADGAWRWFPNRETAIQADYVTIVQQRASNALWTVTGSEVWAGSRVFYGSHWVERKLPNNAGNPSAIVADSRNHIWALGDNRSSWEVDLTVYEWDSAQWIKHRPDLPGYTISVTALTVDRDDTVWMGIQEQFIAPVPLEWRSAVMQLSGAEHQPLVVSTPVAALLTAEDGLWAVGQGWFMSSDYAPHWLEDEPCCGDIEDVIVRPDGKLWVQQWGNAQTLDDRATAGREDDEWESLPLGDYSHITAFDRLGEDLWTASPGGSSNRPSLHVVRYRGTQRLVYAYPGTADFFHNWTYEISDIYAENESRVWLVAPTYDGAEVLGLDDRGAPTDPDNDAWQTIHIDLAQGKLSVAVDVTGALWLGQANGLFRYKGATWEPVWTRWAVCDVVPSANGTVYAQIADGPGATCDMYSNRVLLIRPNGADGFSYAPWLAASEPAAVRSINRPNGLWSVDSTGAIWSIGNYPDVLNRTTAGGTTSYPLPVPWMAVQRFEVDRRSAVWMVAEGKLWRLAGPRPNRVYLPGVSR